jgi:ribose-phosphate pyrophosphokinase
MELFFFCDALRRQEAKKVIGFVPYFGYARQDIQHRDGECISANVVIRFMESIGFSKIYTFDLHDEATSGVFTIPFKNATTFPALATDVKNYLGDRFNKDHIAIASPDQGGIERARNFGIELFGDDDFDLTVVEKHRDQENKHQSEALGIYGQVKDKVVVLVDDIVTSGGTLVHAAQLAMEHGAQSVLAVIVHHDFSEHAKSRIMESRIERFFTTNTIALKEEYRFDKLHEVSVAGLIAEELKGII